MNPVLRMKLINAATAFDIKQSKRKHYNKYALGQYFQAIERLEKYVDAGNDLRLSMLNTFNGRLLDTLLKVAGLPVSTAEECFVGGFEKLPEIVEDEDGN